MKGKYDEEIKTLANLVNQSKGNVFVRWNPEMEVPVVQYPWQYQSPVKYIEAFNHFAGYLKNFQIRLKLFGRLQVIRVIRNSGRERIM
ncbi:hypothetical protein [Pedobacter steynii]